MRGKRVVHDLVPNERLGGWDHRVGGKTVGHHDTWVAALGTAVLQAKSVEMGKVRVRNKNGSIKWERSYGASMTYGGETIWNRRAS